MKSIHAIRRQLFKLKAMRSQENLSNPKETVLAYLDGEIQTLEWVLEG